MVFMIVEKFKTGEANEVFPVVESKILAERVKKFL